jgi:2-keto-4-pentenoate hydratase/2-oxohepta-3-ene-1,7-dioic acid hydratase in catechol pathway
MQRPSKIIGVGRNYAEHAAELGNDVPRDNPLIFLKPPSALIEDGDLIVLPPESDNVHFEGELVVVVGRRGRRVPRSEAFELVAGYACGNDVTARDLQQSEEQWTRAKGFDSFAACGPRVAQIDPSDVTITTRVNGEVRQQATTAQLIHPVDKLISFISDTMTLEPGDLIFTGTPAGVGPLHDGDSVEVEIEGIGILQNRVTAQAQ